MRLPSLIAIAVFTLAVAQACTPSADSTTTTSRTTSTSGPTTTTSTSGPTTTSSPATAADALAGAVDSLIEAGTYAFEAKILLSLQGEPVEAELEGWVDGSDRELIMNLEGRSVTTRVIDGVATVEQGGETNEVPLAEAGAAPSIRILESIRDPRFEDSITISGTLDASDVAASDFEVAGSAAVTVAITSDGLLGGYTLTSSDGSWTVEVRFSDIGEDPR